MQPRRGGRRQRDLPPIEAFDDTDDGDELTLDHRREQVYTLWIRGHSQYTIADTLKISRRTVQRDIEHVVERLQGERLPTFDAVINRSLSTYREVIAAAWSTHLKSPDNSTNRVGALNTVLLAQQRIDELEGVSAPEKVNASAVAQIYEAVTEALREVDPDLQRRFLLALARRNSRPLLGRQLVVTADDVDIAQSDSWDDDDNA